MKNNFLRQAITVAIPVAAAFAIRSLFGVSDWSDLYTVMSLTFLVIAPYIIGVIAIYFSDGDQYKSCGYSATFPWLPITIFLIVTLFLKVEGMACWIMIYPVFLLFSSLGGLTARYFRMRKSKRSGNLHLTLAVLLPFVLGPIEQMIGAIPGFYIADTFIDIVAPREKIWNNITRVREIKESEDGSGLTKVLGIPRPVRAELNYEGVGAYREAIFSGGLVFIETVLTYQDQKLMKFSIKANTQEIPSTTFDEHILIGGDYFDVLEGTYELEKLSDQKFRVHLYSEFKLSTTFNFYASIWGRWIMKDIQNNILHIIKARSESSIHNPEL